MGHRLSKIYTRTGDKGTTGLGDGSRTEKDGARVEAFGTVDELNSVIGLLMTHELPDDVRLILTDIQHELFDLGGELCIPGRTFMSQPMVQRLEKELDKMNDELSPLKEFILPGGTAAAAVAHIARTVCRRAERRLVTLSRSEKINPEAMAYLNRLSDLLFVLARYLNKRASRQDVLWTPGKTSS